MSASVGLAIQCVGVLLVALLSISMRESIESVALKCWTRSWISLSLALLCLFLGFQIAPGQKLFYSLYFFGEYAFGLMFIGGCRFLASGAGMSRRLYSMLIPAALLAVGLPWVSPDFNDLFMIQAPIMAGLFAGSMVALWPALRKGKTSPGLRIIFASLILLTIDFVHYVPVFAARNGLWGMTVPASYLHYTSIFDLILEVLLGFGTIMVLLEGVRSEVEATNRELTEARDKLELMARMDPLTEALNRHAFHSLLSCDAANSGAAVDGCVAVIDIDSLKPINDTYGHSVGDKAIRAVARAVRSLIRADDMLFRWGGDEFLVLMCKLPEDEARRRMRTLNEILEQHGEHWTSSPVRITVSYGVCGFESLQGLGHAIESADQAMYLSREQKRGRRVESANISEPGLAPSNLNSRTVVISPEL
jgi:diguanylate cyclase (GGDEF)-like protein